MTILTDKNNDGAQALMERVLRDGQPIAEEYPLVFRREFPGRLLTLGDEGEVRCACAILVRDFVVDGTRVRGGLIGSVATDPDWRDRGLATRLLIEAEAALQIEGCVFALLWAEDPGFYLKRGYGPIGTENDFLIPPALAHGLPGGSELGEGVRIRAMQAADASAIHRLYERHPVRIARTVEETAALLGCPGMTILVLERGSEPVAYACLGRGHDLLDAIHEWGGEADDVLALVRAHLEQRELVSGDDGGLFLMAPPAATELNRRLVSLGALSKQGILGLGKVLDRTAAAALLDERLAPLGSAELVEADDGRPFRVRGPKQEGHVDDEGALALLFSVAQVRGEVEKFLVEFGLEQAQLPIEPFAWGLDSI